VKVLVTGASGLLGGHVAEALSWRGDHVRALVRKTSSRTHLEKLTNVELFEGAVEEVDRVALAVEGVDAIVHCAGIVKARDADHFFAVNVGGTSNLVDAARKRGKSLKRFVHVSSLEAVGPSHDGGPVPPDQQEPVTSYGRSKLAAERVVQAAKNDVDVVILRPGAIYGPRDVEVYQAFLSIKRGLLPLIGGGAAKGVWIYATDCANACVRAIDADVPSGSTYFVDDGCGPLALRQMLSDAERAMGRKALIRASLPPSVLATVARGVQAFGKLTGKAVMLTPEKANMLMMDWVCSSEATRRELQWEPKVPWSEGVVRAVAWYEENGWL
jgi:nucleoside-diphosphate-sugar epimerase